MGAAVPFLIAQQGTARTSSKNQYVTQENTRDEALDGVKYPLHRLSREKTARSDAAAHVVSEQERVRRLFPNSGVR